VFSTKIKIGVIYLVSILFVLGNMYFISKNEYYAFALPFGLFFLLLYFFALDKLIWLIVLVTPLAITLKDENFGLGVSLPTEPLMAGVLLIFILKVFFDWKFEKDFLKHPVSLAILFSLIWIFFTTLTSELPIVSLKFLVSRLWFIIPFYFILSKLIKKSKDIRLFSWLYIIPLIAVVIYTSIHHSFWGFERKAGTWVMWPFYNDHTAYGMILAFYIPITISLIFVKDYKKSFKLFSFLASLILFIGLFLSYSRAAWLSLVAGIAVFILIYFKIKFRYITITFLIVLGLFFSFQNQILDRLSKNDQDSSANFMEHISSASNIASDASNLERINRWACAIRLFEERPLVGWGPGTYQFVYAPMQKAKEKTIISTDFGDGGNAHSEYLGPLAERGLLGIASFLFIAIAILYTGIRVYKRETNISTKQMVLGILIGYVSYFTHGFLNNFLDTDKASVPFWGFAVVLVVLDLKQRRHRDEENKLTPKIDD
jgi:putative inorganic carbon (HCO3(-)) transporter